MQKKDYYESEAEYIRDSSITSNSLSFGQPPLAAIQLAAVPPMPVAGKS